MSGKSMAIWAVVIGLGLIVLAVALSSPDEESSAGRPATESESQTGSSATEKQRQDDIHSCETQCVATANNVAWDRTGHQPDEQRVAFECVRQCQAAFAK